MRSIFAGERDGRHEDARGLAGLHRGVGDGDAVIAAGCGDDADCGDGAGQEVGDGAARLERAGVLEELELENDAVSPTPASIRPRSAADDTGE